MGRELRGHLAAATIGAIVYLALPSLASAAVPADFNGDGRSDLAAGSECISPNGQNCAGAFDVIYSGKKRLGVRGKLFSLKTKGVPGDPHQGDHLGGSGAASGDFDGDGFADLAMGLPFSGIGGKASAGKVLVMYGSNRGIRAKRSHLYTQDTKGLANSPEEGDTFGAALTAGDFNGDGRDDLAIGVAFADLATNVPDCGHGEDAGAGAVHVLFGSAHGLRTAHSQFLHDANAEPGDCFGGALAAGDFNGDHRSDLAVGVPFEDDLAVTDGGEVQVFKGAKKGLKTSPEITLRQGLGGVNDVFESADTFGAALATGDANGDKMDDLAIGAPGETVGADSRAGATAVVYGSTGGPSPITIADQIWTEDNFGGVSNPGERFGWDVALGKLDTGKFADLVVGAHREDDGANMFAGVGFVAFGSAGGVSASQAGPFDLGSMGFGTGDGDRLGENIAIGRFGNDKHYDIAVSARTRTGDGPAGSGAVGVLYGPDPLVASHPDLLDHSLAAVPPAASAGQKFGSTLAP